MNKALVTGLCRIGPLPEGQQPHAAAASERLLQAAGVIHPPTATDSDQS